MHDKKARKKRKMKSGSSESVIHALESFYKEIMSIMSQTDNSLKSSKKFLKTALKKDLKKVSNNLNVIKHVMKDIEDVEDTSLLRSLSAIKSFDAKDLIPI